MRRREDGRPLSRSRLPSKAAMKSAFSLVPSAAGGSR
uniref:Uncharacterized protein n=1 Tax=Arundo donax TaxID=35708 RepID=A0A0A8ZR05_ARUDO